MSPAEIERIVSSALYAAAEALHQTVQQDPTAVLEALSKRSDACDSVIGQIGAAEFHAMLSDLTGAACAFLRTEAARAVNR